HAPQRHPDSLGWRSASRRVVRDALAPGVHARVRATRTADLDRRFVKLAQGRLQRPLHRAQAVLTGEAAKLSAVVRDAKEDRHDGRLVLFAGPRKLSLKI